MGKNTYLNTYPEKMATKKSGEENTRKLTKIGKRSFAVTIPIEIICQLGWREKQRVKVKRIKGGIQIRDWRKRK
jgi:hypothetical protein